MDRQKLDLTFSVRSTIWGDNNDYVESSNEPDTNTFTKEKKNEVLKQDKYKCAFCGFESLSNEIHSINDNHYDLSDENLCAADPLCHTWQHLESISDKDAVVALIPGLKPEDVNHLQRTIFIALQSDDKTVKSEAKALLNWLASHKEYLEEFGSCWTTSKPAVFAKALKKLDQEQRNKRQIVLEDLVLIFNPVFIKNYVQGWFQDCQQKMPLKSWKKHYVDTKNLISIRGK
ncbi:hypothetical protein KCM76_22270 [Zooshikella marina]|uniref:hypothetical protein n=1 Tax=Zooshikella ganghwensis TaxID=202772 RepID=UPI001BAF4742|nr:hypothetical protein [Zooshikella ganghwensis]MBU2708735.1 hypothetical protein [Zooshikella ganghwensis]